MDIFLQLFQIGILPLASPTDPAQAVPLAQALQKGGLPALEVAFRTPAAAESLARIHRELPDFLLGAGTITTLEAAKLAVASGARFLVSPSLDPEVVRFAAAEGVPILPGVCTPAEVEQARRLGLTHLKFFPAAAGGGPAMLRALRGPYPEMRFLPTGGLSAENFPAYLAEGNVFACAGSWLVPGAAREAGDFAQITALCEQAVDRMLNLRFAHLGINNPDEAAGRRVAALFAAFLHSEVDDKPASLFPCPQIESIKYPFRGKNGHIAFFCSNIERSVFHLRQRGVFVKEDSYESDAQGLRVVYLAEEFGGFAIHLVRA